LNHLFESNTTQRVEENSIMKKWIVIIVGCLLSGFLTTASAAEKRGWETSITPYFWAINMEGDVGIDNIGTVPIDVDFDDVTDNLESAFALAIEVRKDNRWIFLVDGQYLGLGTEETSSLGVTKEIDLDGYMLGAFVGYRMGTEVFFDILAGARFVKQEVEINIPQLGSRSRSENWADALGGLRIIVPFTQQIGVSCVGLVGAGDSNLTWEVLPLVYWNITEHIGLKAGYRYLSYDFDKDEFIYDVDTDGFIAGVTVKF
jgi:opacity protein-like surface antigen